MGVNLLVAHGGGPTPVINSSLQGVIEGAREGGRVQKLYAARFGAEGLLKADLIDLTDLSPTQVALLDQTPASAIGSCRRKLGEDDYPALLECFRKYHIDVFLYNGGNDSMDTCLKISRLARREGLELMVLGIPKTIDNDLAETDHSPGYGSAARYAAVSAAELALDVQALPIHVVVLELMGRNAGWLTAASAFAGRLTGCPQLTYLPERPLDEGRMLADVERLYAKGGGLLVTVSEGLRGPDGRPLSDSGIVDGFGHTVPGGTAQAVAERITGALGLKARAEKPGLLGRTSMPYVSRTDREEAYTAGRFAVEAALRGESGSMVSIRAHRGEKYRFSLELVPLEKVANVEKSFPAEWIGEGTVEPAFFDYCAPLMGAALPHFAKLR